jgi:small subunit ribosomal protein S6
MDRSEGRIDHEEEIMRRYETTYILRPNLGETLFTEVIDRTNDIIKNDGGAIISFDRWGVKKLAYEIKKENLGYYIYFDFAAPATTVLEMERIFRLDDNVLRFLTIKLADSIDQETIDTETELAAAEVLAQQEAAAAESSETESTAGKTTGEDTTKTEKEDIAEEKSETESAEEETKEETPEETKAEEVAEEEVTKVVEEVAKEEETEDTPSDDESSEEDKK